jgi:hypothetical protein
MKITLACELKCAKGEKNTNDRLAEYTQNEAGHFLDQFILTIKNNNFS